MGIIMDFLRKLRKIGRIWEMEWASEVVVQMILFVGTAIAHNSGSLEAVHVVSSQALLVCHRSKAKNF